MIFFWAFVWALPSIKNWGKTKEVTRPDKTANIGEVGLIEYKRTRFSKASIFSSLSSKLVT